MRHFLSPDIGNTFFAAPKRSLDRSIISSMSSARPFRNFRMTLLVVFALVSLSFAQINVPTSRVDNTRSGANTNETLLAPSNINKNSFGKLFSSTVDYVVMAQPLYMSGINIPGQGTHNVMYVATQADSVYAIDADTGAQLWYASMLNNVGAGATTASGKYLPCANGTGFSQEGVVGTPVIDPNTNTIYLVAKTVLNGTVRHHLHALDITTGNEQPGSPVLIQATSISNAGHKTVFNSLHQKNRPGLLLLNGVLYLGFGSNSCNDANSGWVLGYSEATLTQLAVFNTSPDYGLTSIWESGNGLAADEAGNIFFETAEAGSHGFDVPNGGQTYCNSVVELSPSLINQQNNQYEVEDYFTPWYVSFLNSNDLDLSSTGVLILPDQTSGPSQNGHELIAGGKEGMVYVLDRDALGWYSANDSQVLQELPLPVPKLNIGPGTSKNEIWFGSPTYWNNTVYIAPDDSPLMAFPLSGGLLGTPVLSPGSTTYSGSHSPAISANGNTNGVLWVISGTELVAFDAVSLQLLYTSNQAPSKRDAMGTPGHFVTPTIDNGKVYVAAETQTNPPAYALEAFGLFHAVTITGGNAQTGTAGSTLPVAMQVNIANPYNGQPDSGDTVTFSDGGKGGSFSPASAITDNNGNASAYYTLPKKTGTYALTATLMVNNVASGAATTTGTATPGGAAKIIAYGGSKQTGGNGFILANPIVAQVQDANKNNVPGATVTFTANKGAVPNPSSVTTDATGMARTYLQLPPTAATVTVTASTLGPNGSTLQVTYIEYSVPPNPNISISGGNNQLAAAGTQLTEALTVLVKDQFNDVGPGVNVTFSDNSAGGTFSNGATVVTGASGTATEFYTLPTLASAITIDATASGVPTPGVFAETSVAGPPANITVTGGNNQVAPVGTLLPQALVVSVADQYGNVISSAPVTFNDGGAGGTFFYSNPVVTDNTGTATQMYTLPQLPGALVIMAATGTANPASFVEAGQ